MADFKIKYQIAADAALAKSEIRSVDDLLSGVGSKIGSGITGPAAVAGTTLAVLGTAAVAVGSKLFDLSKQASDFGSEIFDASKKTGLGAEAISAMKFAADQSGASLENITGGIAKFAKEVGSAADGSEKAAAKLKDLGIEPQDAINDLDGALAKVFKRIADAPPGIERMTLAQKAFGKSGADLLPFIDSFDGDLEGLIKRAKELGVTIDDEAARAADEFGDQLDTLSTQMDATGRMLGMELIPVLSDFFGDMSGWLSQNKGEVKGWAEDIAYYVRKLIVDIKSELNDLEGIKQALTGFFSAETSEQIGQRLQGVRTEAARLQILRQQGYKDNSWDTASPGNIATDDYAAFISGMLPSGARPKVADEADAIVSRGRKARTSGGDDRTDKQAYQDFVKALKEFGVEINSGFRTFKEQQALFKKLGPGQAARPGTSDHEFWKAVDLPVGVTQEILDAAAIKAGVTLGKRNVHEGTGLHNHQSFKKGRGAGGGEEAIAEALAAEIKFQEEMLAGAQATLDEWIREEQRASDERLALRRAEAEQALVILEDQLDAGELTEREHIERIGQLRIEMLLEEQNELANQIQTRETQQRLLELSVEIQTARLQKENAIEKSIRDQNKAYQDQISQLRKANQRPSTLRTRTPMDQFNPFEQGLFGEDGLDIIRSEAMEFEQIYRDMGAMVGDSVGQMIGGIGSLVEAWVLYGDLGPNAVRKMTASILAGLAAQAAVKAIFQLAEGFAALFFNPAEAAAHFKAAALYGAVAVAAGVAGRAIAGDSFSKDGGKGGGSSSGMSRDSERNMTPISKQNENTFISSRGNVFQQAADAIDRLEKKISSMPASEVVTIGAKQNPGAIAAATVQGVRTNSSHGTNLKRAMGDR